MIVTLRPNADADSVRRELIARGLWVTALHDGARVANGQASCGAIRSDRHDDKQRRRVACGCCGD